MRSLRLPWRRQSKAAYTEHIPHDGQERHTACIVEPNPPRPGALDCRQGEDAVLGLIGIGSIDRALAIASTPGACATGDVESADTLVDALHAQYWRTLSDPHASLAGSCARPVDEPSTHAATREAPDQPQAEDTHRESTSVEAMLLGECMLEDLFGRLEETLALEEPHVPEVLRLFAPLEFHVADARRAPALPPALTRREHHGLSVDSPLAAPSRENDA
jgi:hypothetical protein